MIVRKYSNRRLYDTEGSRYITLEEIAQKIRAGVDVRVLDAKSGEDLTQATLTQIILESRGAGRLLPVPLLIQLIRLGDEALAEFLGRYLSYSLEMYLQAKQQAQAVAQVNPFAQLPFTATNAFARWFTGGSPWGEAAPPPPPSHAPPSAPPAGGAGDVAALRRELDELKREMRKKRK